MAIGLFVNNLSMDMKNISISESHLIIDSHDYSMYIFYIQWKACICDLMIFYLYYMIVDILAVYNFYCVEVAVSLYPIRVFYSSVTYQKGLYYIPILSLRIVMYIHCKIYLYAIILLDKNDTKY